MKKFNVIVTLMGVLIATLSTIACLMLYATKPVITDTDRAYLFVVVALGILIMLLSLILSRHLIYRQNTNDKYDQAATYLNELIKYNKKRDEIEEEIKKLTKQLEHSSAAQYLDINRLAFSGQNNNSTSSNAINYGSFLKQFGLEKEQLEIKSGTAAFLTPFDAQGKRLFNTCQTILGKVDIFLRRTDNMVEKDDILMNIVTMIVQSEFVLVNIDGRNPNVYYELGIAHALGKPTILLSRAFYDLDDVGFDIRQKRIIVYRDNQDLEKQLLGQISMLRRTAQ